MVQDSEDLAATFTGELQAGATDSHWPVRTANEFIQWKDVGTELFANLWDWMIYDIVV